MTRSSQWPLLPWCFSRPRPPTSLLPKTEERVLSDRQTGADPRWIYNDFDRATALAAETRKPMLVVLRCIP
jgi:hypothetical protein